MSAEAYWSRYFDAMADRGPRQTLLDALERFEREGRTAPTPDATTTQATPSAPAGATHIPGSCPCHPAAAGVALDLACGDGADTLELLRRRWCVLAIDAHPVAIQRLRARVPEELTPYLRTGVEPMEEMPMPPEMFELINASMALPHCPAPAFAGLWERVAAALRPGGRFAGQFFGPRDEWAAHPEPGVPRVFHTREQVEALLAAGSLEAERFEEVERRGRDAFGRAKRWHVFHIVARKVGGSTA